MLRSLFDIKMLTDVL